MAELGSCNTSKMALTVPCVAIRGSTGISVSYGPPSYEVVSSFKKDDSRACKAMAYSPQGKFLAWANGTNIKIISCQTWQLIAEIPKPKVLALAFSPQDTYLMSWEPFIVNDANPQGNPNLNLWNPLTGAFVKGFVHKKQTDWEPLWTDDEKVCGMLVNNDVVLYENDFTTVAHKMNVGKIAKFSIAPGREPYHICCHLPGKSGQPSFGSMFQYPKFKAPEHKPVATKSFYHDDRINFYWNKQGSNMLLLASTEVDKTGASYYGKQTLLFYGTKCQPNLVALSKEGPIHAVQWSPKSTEFIVIYGSMPSKATLFNLKCEPIFEFGTKHRNAILYNPHGNIVILTGTGNLRGDIELWDTKKHKLIATTESPDTTLMEWSPDGEHYMTATTAPRLRVSNGFNIFHYTGTLLFERPWNKQEELWEVQWQKFPAGTFKENVINYTTVEGIAPSRPTASKEAYRPPSARNSARTAFSLYDDVDDKKPTKQTIPNKPSKNAKKRERKQIKKQEQAAALGENVSVNGQSATPSAKSTNSTPNPEPTDDPEKNKAIKKIRTKLDQIAKLKEQQNSGKKLEINQLDKIKKEAELIKEMEELML
ncbi:eukaryotic translation initiation factor 2A [Trichogramma pretiosum]|uniref:eukaryotic translation initiation factor 2A n=1 Tax=Trichogramma pretiosum TaxID=7493 RepID=UPI0006C95593|nr:eukaryotic translation initiation factor 2A [Trichogramma pretiosum]